MRLRSKYPDLTLDIYGSAGLWGRADYLNVEELRKIAGLTFHGAVSQEELATVYREAGLLVIPSISFDAFESGRQSAIIRSASDGSCHGE